MRTPCLTRLSEARATHVRLDARFRKLRLAVRWTAALCCATTDQKHRPTFNPVDRASLLRLEFARHRRYCYYCSVTGLGPGAPGA